jgi:hypothetical protein
MTKYRLVIEFETESSSVELVMDLTKPIIRGMLNELTATMVNPTLESVEDEKEADN